MKVTWASKSQLGRFDRCWWCAADILADSRQWRLGRGSKELVKGKNKQGRGFLSLFLSLSLSHKHTHSHSSFSRNPVCDTISFFRQHVGDWMQGSYPDLGLLIGSRGVSHRPGKNVDQKKGKAREVVAKIPADLDDRVAR